MSFDPEKYWERIHAERSVQDLSWHQQRPALSLELIAHSGLAPDVPIIDVGGGASLLVDHLLAAGHRDLTVLDISTTALASAQRRLGARAQAVNWLVADVLAFRPARRYALWHDRAVFHFLTEPAARRRYVETLGQTLAPDGHVVMAAFAPGGPTQCSGLPVEQYDGARMQDELGAAYRLVEERAESHVTPSGRTQLFAYFRFLRQAA